MPLLSFTNGAALFASVFDGELEKAKPTITPIAQQKPISDAKPVDHTIPVRELNGALLYAALMTRPDIALAVQVVAR